MQVRAQLESPRVTRKELALSRARELLRAGRVEEPPVDVIRLARILGVARIKTTRLPSSEACLVPGENAHTILLSDLSSPRRNRFSIAHEIGHILLRSGGIRFRGFSRERHDYEERLCDYLAAEIIFPIDFFRNALQDLEPSIDAIGRLANRFEATVESTARRMGELNASGASVVCWQVHGKEMRIKWHVGHVPRSMRQSHDSDDMSFGPALALHADGPMTGYEWSQRPASLDTISESMSYGGKYPFVITVARPDTIWKRSETKISHRLQQRQRRGSTCEVS